MKFNLVMSSILEQDMSAMSGPAPLASPGLVLTGVLAVENALDPADSQQISWSATLDETTLQVESNKTILLKPGTYDFYLLLESPSSRQYLGEALGETIADGSQTTIGITLSPVIGDPVTDASLLSEVAGLKFQYDPAELSGFTTPSLGISIDGGAEEYFIVNPTTGLTDGHINLPEGTYTIQLRFHDGPIQYGKSSEAQETVYIQPGVGLSMDLEPINGEVISLLTAGVASFQFNLPAEIVEEVGGDANLDTNPEVRFSMAGPQNPLQEKLLTLAADPSGSYTTQTSLADIVPDYISMQLRFTDTSSSPGRLFAWCVLSHLFLYDNPVTKLCRIGIHRKGAIFGSLLATLGLNVYNADLSPAPGAVVFLDGEPVGLTGGGTFGSAGYLKLFLLAGGHILRVEGTSMYHEQSINLAPLSTTNLDITLDTPF